nr:reverse transcriptase domain-containing protein [Tanacetum cinerariifolium]
MSHRVQIRWTPYAAVEEKPLPPVDSPTAELPGYVVELDLEEDPEEDDADDEDKEEEEEHIAPADSVVVIPTVELVSPPEGTEHALIDAVTAALPLSPLPPLTPSVYIPPPVNRRDDTLESELPPRKRLCLSTLGFRYVVGESSTARPTRGRGIDDGFVSTLDVEARRQGIGEVWYGIRDTSVDTAEAVPEIAPMTLGEVNTRVTELAELHEHDTHDLYALLEDPRDSVVGLTRWIEKMESVFNISSCAIENQVKFATCTLLGATQTWWNGQIRCLGPDAYSMTWEVLKKKITDRYCLQGEIKKLEIKLWNLKVKGNDVSTYTKSFQELTLICIMLLLMKLRRLTSTSVDSLKNIYGSVRSFRPKTLDETIELANDFVDQKLRTYAER